MKIQQTTTLRKIITLMKQNPSAHTYCLPGGQGSGKTSAVLLILINHALQAPGWDCYVAGKELSKMKVTTIKTFKQIMESLNLYNEENFKGNVDYIFSNGAHIRFLSLDRPGAYKGNRSDCVFVDEANECGWNAYRELTDRSKKVIASWNPNFKSFMEDIVMKLPGVVTCRTTFRDNEFCPQNEVEALLNYKIGGYNEDGTIKNAELARLWQIYGLGIPSKAVGAIYTNWEIGEFKEMNTVLYGADFGSNDPSTLIQVSIDNNNKIIYMKELIYQRGCGSFDLVNLYKQVLPSSHLVIGDSAAPMTITDLRKSGINIKACVKGKIIDEVQVLQSYKFIIDPDSKNLQFELDNCRYADSDTKTTILPGNDHCFSKDTIITCKDGNKRIIDVKVGDEVLTSKGYRKVNKFFNNGIKQTYKYTIKLENDDTIVLNATSNHKVKTLNDNNEIEWKELRQLKKKDRLFRYSMEENIENMEHIGFIKHLDIDYIEMFMNTLMERYLKDTKFTIKTITPTIIKSKILKCLKSTNILKGIYKKDYKMKNVEKRLCQIGKKQMTRQQNIIKALDSIKKCTKRCQRHHYLAGQEEVISSAFVKFVEKNLKREVKLANTVQAYVKTIDLAKKDNVKNVEIISLQDQLQEDVYVMTVKEIKSQKVLEDTEVFDLEINDIHEFFANGILVHNCLDAMRYAVMHILKAPKRDTVMSIY